MAFIRTESWIAPTPQHRLWQLPGWVGHRWTSRSAALVASLAIDAGIIGLLLTMGDLTSKTPMREAQSISTIDITSRNAQATSASASSASASASTTPPTKIDTTTLPPILKEWTVTTLPPVTVSTPTPAPPAPPSQVAVSQAGSGSTGNTNGAGYDPYAYASYRSPPVPGSAIAVSPAAIARLEALLRGRFALRGMQIAAHVDIDGQGRIVRFAPDTAMTPAIAASVSAAMIGFALCEPDVMRPMASGIAVTLHI